MTGPGETRLRQQIKEVRDLGEVGFDSLSEVGLDVFYLDDEPADEEREQEDY